ncbi:hypothetical protein D3C85_1242080 [compost metagenome]
MLFYFHLHRGFATVVLTIDDRYLQACSRKSDGRSPADAARPTRDQSDLAGKIFYSICCSNGFGASPGADTKILRILVSGLEHDGFTACTSDGSRRLDRGQARSHKPAKHRQLWVGYSPW